MIFEKIEIIPESTHVVKMAECDGCGRETLQCLTFDVWTVVDGKEYCLICSKAHDGYELINNKFVKIK